jgi:hypothetical protein
MGVLDLYSADFPHGTTAGFDAGCRSASACSFHGDANWLTCKEAQLARASDYNLSKLPRDQKIPRPETSPALPAKPKPRTGTKADSLLAPLGVNTTSKPKPAPPVTPPLTDAAPAAAADTEPVDQVIEAPVPEAAETIEKPAKIPRNLPLDDPRFPHGKPAGYARGCRNDDDSCPAHADGLSCAASQRKYMADYRAARAANLVAETAAQLPDDDDVETPAVETPDAEQTSPGIAVGAPRSLHDLALDIINDADMSVWDLPIELPDTTTSTTAAPLVEGFWDGYDPDFPYTDTAHQAGVVTVADGLELTEIVRDRDRLYADLATVEKERDDLLRELATRKQGAAENHITVPATPGGFTLTITIENR